MEANGINSNYSCFWPFVVQSGIIIRLWCHVRFICSNNMNKNLNNNSKMAEFYLIFVMLFNICPNVIQYLRQYLLQPWTIIFVICLQFNLGYRGLWLALRTNLQSEPLFAEVWYQTYFPISNFYPRQGKINILFLKTIWGYCWSENEKFWNEWIEDIPIIVISPFVSIYNSMIYHKARLFKYIPNYF